MTVIHHLFYPHIIDLIWSYLDYSAHKVLMKVCTAWRTRTSQRLRHLVVTCRTEPDEPLQLIFSTRDSSRPTLPPAQLCCVPWSYEPPDWYLDSDTLTDHEMNLLHFQHYLNTQNPVVDFVGFDELSEELIDSSMTSTALLKCTVRWFGDPPRLLAFDHPFGGPPPLVDVFLMDFDPESAPCGVWSYRLGLEERSCSDPPVVVNFRCHGDVTECPAEPFDPHHLQEVTASGVVLIVHNDIPEGARTKPKLELGLVLDFCYHIHCPCKVTVVGLDLLLDRETLKGYIASLEEELTKGRVLEGTWQGMHWEPDEDCLDRLRFQTHAGYKAEVGEALYMIHTAR